MKGCWGRELLTWNAFLLLCFVLYTEQSSDQGLVWLGVRLLFLCLYNVLWLSILKSTMNVPNINIAHFIHLLYLLLKHLKLLNKFLFVCLLWRNVVTGHWISLFKQFTICTFSIWDVQIIWSIFFNWKNNGLRINLMSHYSECVYVSVTEERQQRQQKSQLTAQ